MTPTIRTTPHLRVTQISPNKAVALYYVSASKLPPPDYATALSMGLPSYEAAIKLDPRLLNSCVDQPFSPSSFSSISSSDMSSFLPDLTPGTQLNQVTTIHENQFRKSEPDKFPGSVMGVNGKNKRISSSRQGSSSHQSGGSTPAPTLPGMYSLFEVGTVQPLNVATYRQDNEDSRIFLYSP